MSTRCDIDTERKTAYMACPYSSYVPEPEGTSYCDRYSEAFTKANRGCAYLMVARNRVVFSPITHSHILDPYTGDPSHSFWLTQDYYWVKMADELWILQLNGWDSSFGVGWEHGVATLMNKPIHYLPWETVEAWERSR